MSSESWAFLLGKANPLVQENKPKKDFFKFAVLGVFSRQKCVTNTEQNLDEALRKFRPSLAAGVRGQGGHQGRERDLDGFSVLGFPTQKDQIFQLL